MRPALIRRAEPAWVKPTLFALVFLFLATFVLLPLAVILIDGLRKGSSSKACAKAGRSTGAPSATPSTWPR
jgi:ABC-type sulfate transport system permease subunit